MNPTARTASAVFDCVVLLQGAARPGSPAVACLDLAERDIVELCVSQEILAEVEG